MGHDRDEAARHQDATEAMIRMREQGPGRRLFAAPHPDQLSDQVRAATAATALVMATLSAHASSLPEHVIKAAAIAAGNATIQRTPE